LADSRIVTVFGGTGFLGRRVTRHLCDHGFAVRVATRHPKSDPGENLEFVRADVGEAGSVAHALSGAHGAVNAVSLYVERGRQTFHAVHVEAAERVARLAREAGVVRLVHLSGLGADPHSPSQYIRARGQGEEAVRRAFPGAVIIRPSVMFGPDDAFLTGLKGMLRKTPVFPMFGRGETKLQPNHVEDVAEAIARIKTVDTPAPLYEFGGPRVFSYRDILETIARQTGAKAALVPVPFALWRMLATAAELLPSPPITRNQVDLMENDNVTAEDRPGFGALGIAPRGVESELGAIRRPAA
jgi:NADH dehydrogenase